ncbi:MAG: aconitate hydratase [Eubacteriaceae bacterium]|jgi:aconitate hydratase|nr:aconitate hydratase [Eubacteriaceae bacterium]
MQNLVEKIISSHLAEGEMIPGSEIGLHIDRTLTQDSTGTMAYLQYEAITDEAVKTDRSVAYVDHNMIQDGPENMDDHLYIQSIADKIGVVFSRPGNGICHRLNLDRFSVPAQTLLGSDSHTPTCGAVGMLAIGAGGLDVAAAMAGSPYRIAMPDVIGVKLSGSLRNGVGAKDLILKLLSILSVKGGVGKAIEYFGEGVSTLSVSERATIANMGAELGATASVFPADDRVRAFFAAQHREEDFRPIAADPGCSYSRVIEISLDELAPLAACPHMPDAVREVSELEGVQISQVCVGSCTNSSFEDLSAVASILKGKTVSPNVSFTVSPGSRQVLDMLAQSGALSDLLNAGARILECACGPCIGMGSSPNSGGVSLRTFNRNFKGRSGTADAQVYLVSPETAALSALHGYMASPLGKAGEKAEEPKSYLINDNMFVWPEADRSKTARKGPNIKPFPKAAAPEEDLRATVAAKLSDNITTDDIMPSNAKLLPYRSNIEYLSDYCLTPVDPLFPQKAKSFGQSAIVAGLNYGQGSSREHAALAPLYLGVKLVLAKSFARIHRANLINNGIIPATFLRGEDWDEISEGDALLVRGAPGQLSSPTLQIENATKGTFFAVRLDASERERAMLAKGGAINLIKSESGKKGV